MIGTIYDAKKEIKLLREITKRYFAKRTIRDIVPEEWVQAMLDSNSSRKKGRCGEDKLIHILKKYGFKEVVDWQDFSESRFCVARFSKKFNLKDVRKNLRVKIKKQGKKLDLVIKAKNRILICEAKHLNTSGGGQDKQISELIEVLSLSEKNATSYISFLDGKYSNVLLSDIGCGDKIATQRQEITKFLKKNPNNYWVNSVGFENLIYDLKQ